MTMVLSFGLIVSHVNAQVKYEMEITYSASYGIKKVTKKLGEDLQQLQIAADGRSRYYSIWSERNDFVMDSLANAGIDPMTMIQERKRLGVHTGQAYQIYKNIPDKNKLTYVDKFFEELYYVEDIPKINWQMEEGDTIIAEYPCQKATGFWRGHKWTVWFTMDIPVSEGPWKLGGLPGLIMKASENSEHYSFTCVGISKANDKLFNLPDTKKMTKSTFKKIQELTEMGVNDIRGMLQNTLGIDPGEIKDQNGEVIKMEKVELIFIEDQD